MIEIYSHDTKKFADQGLQLRLPVDSIPPNQYSRLSNCVADIEGQLETRAGTTLVASLGGEGITLPVHTIFRLNQNSSATASNRLVGAQNALFSQQLPNSAFAIVTPEVTYDGLPLNIIDFRFDNDPSSWAIIGNSQGMRKQRLPALYQILGETPPTLPATATAGAAGLLNNGSGPGYDWRYTYVNSIVNSQSNPSPVDVPTGTQRPTVNVNPDPGTPAPSPIVQTGCVNPTFAYDNNPATAAVFSATSNPPSQESCLFKTWASTGPITLVNINIDSAVTITGDTGSVIASIYWSKDSGLTWNTLFSTYVSRDRTTDKIAVPSTIDLASIQVKGVVYGAATSGGGGGGGGGVPCPLSGAPVKLYGDPLWWSMEVQPNEDWIEIVTVTGRRGLFTPDDRRFCDRGLIEVQKWEAGFYALVDDTEERLELVESVRNIHLPGATADHYHATEGHVYSAWGFVGHNNKIAPSETP